MPMPGSLGLPACHAHAGQPQALVGLLGVTSWQRDVAARQHYRGVTVMPRGAVMFPAAFQV
jgi:hypothetical protein